MFKKQVISVVLVMVLVLSIAPITVEATATGVNNGIEFVVNYPEPATSESQGYINVLVQNTSSGEYCVETYFWYCVAYSNGVESPCSMYITVSPGGLVFNPGGVTGVSGAFYSIASVGADGVFGFQTSSSSSSFNLDLQRWGWQVIAFKFKGNVASITNNIGVSQTMKYTVYYAGDGSSVLLMDIIGLLQSSNNIDSSVLSTVQGILASVDGLENQLSSVISYLQSVDSKLSSISSQLQLIYQKADTILNEQKETNNWLEKIFNYLNESAEKQKQEAQTQGNNSTSQGMNAIEDKGAGFTNSLGSLTNSMSYNGTECAWSMPQIKLPSIPGVMDEVVLLESQPIDFSQWVAVIPSNIMLVIQSVLTLGLIVYCFKELYNTIAYVLTLRKDDNS